jgi:hypothetical protein
VKPVALTELVEAQKKESERYVDESPALDDRCGPPAHSVTQVPADGTLWRLFLSWFVQAHRETSYLWSLSIDR